MVSNELTNIIELLKKQGEMCFLESASEEQIAAFETTHAIKLPTKYREWLLFSDGGEFFLPAGIQLYGVAHKPVIDVDDDSRPDDSYTVIGVLSNGDPILCKRDDELIAIYNQEASKIEDDEKYTDFFAFLNDLYDMLGIGG